MEPTTTTSVLNTVITSEMLQGVLDEIISILPACVGVMVAFISIRKAIAFLQSILHSA